MCLGKNTDEKAGRNNLAFIHNSDNQFLVTIFIKKQPATKLSLLKSYILESLSRSL